MCILRNWANVGHDLWRQRASLDHMQLYQWQNMLHKLSIGPLVKLVFICLSKGHIPDCILLHYHHITDCANFKKQSKGGVEVNVVGGLDPYVIYHRIDILPVGYVLYVLRSHTAINTSPGEVTENCYEALCVAFVCWKHNIIILA